MGWIECTNIVLFLPECFVSFYFDFWPQILPFQFIGFFVNNLIMLIIYYKKIFCVIKIGKKNCSYDNFYHHGCFIFEPRTTCDIVVNVELDGEGWYFVAFGAYVRVNGLLVRIGRCWINSVDPFLFGLLPQINM